MMRLEYLLGDKFVKPNFTVTITSPLHLYTNYEPRPVPHCVATVMITRWLPSSYRHGNSSLLF